MTLSDCENQIIDETLQRHPALECCAGNLMRLHQELVKTYDGNGKTLLCGNGGSQADAMHIAGELNKSFTRKRPIPSAISQTLKSLPHGQELAEHLEAALPAITIGLNPSLKTAVENDSPMRDIAFAQETFALAKPEDVLIAISTSGNADNCVMAISTAKAIGATTVSLTGPGGGEMAKSADIAIKAPGDSTQTIQEVHVILYHTFCALIEAHYFPESREG